uniref:O-fucosyltransferase family protein n=1 Tax=Anthurium amnicola TaxID=1678845 RepID=A0A1D1YS17_9ARAE
MGICDAVAVAKILNATLVIPYLEENPVWKDSSTFEDIFDVDHFISILKYDIPIVRELPKEYSWSTREYYAVAIRATRVKTAPVHASANWYLDNVLPVLQRKIKEVTLFFGRLKKEEEVIHNLKFEGEFGQSLDELAR